MAANNNRVGFIDMMKGTSILIVVFCHIMAPCGFRNALEHLMDAMLLTFFFCSGYFYHPGKRPVRECGSGSSAGSAPTRC